MSWLFARSPPGVQVQHCTTDTTQRGFATPAHALFSQIVGQILKELLVNYFDIHRSRAYSLAIAQRSVLEFRLNFLSSFSNYKVQSLQMLIQTEKGKRASRCLLQLIGKTDQYKVAQCVSCWHRETSYHSQRHAAQFTVASMQRQLCVAFFKILFRRGGEINQMIKFSHGFFQWRFNWLSTTKDQVHRLVW